MSIRGQSFDNSFRNSFRGPFRNAFGDNLGAPNIAPSLITADGDNTNTTAYTTASFTANKNSLVLLSVISGRLSNPPSAPTVATAGGITWVAVSTILYSVGDATEYIITTFRGLPTAPTASTQVITYPNSMRGANWSISQFGNVDTGGANGADAIAQSTGNSQTAVDATISASLIVGLGAQSLTYIAGATDINETFDAVTDQTTLSNEAGSATPRALYTAFKTNLSQTGTATWTTNADAAIIVAEIKIP